MKHLKRFNERLGVLSGLEEQVEEYMKEIEKKPTSNVFNFVYRCDLGNYNFKLIIDTKLDRDGYFTGSANNTDLEIYLKDRTDDATLFHEVKHLDFHIRKKGKTRTPYTKSQFAISQDGKNTKVSKKTLHTLEMVFYIYDENEFQSRFHGFYKNFDTLMSKLSIALEKQGKKLTTDLVKHIFYNEKWDADRSFSWYTPDEGYDFKFEKFVPKDELRLVFYYIIMEQKRKTFSNIYLDFLSYKVHQMKKDIKTFFKIFTDKEKQEIEKYITYFEKDINRKIKKYKRRMSRIVTIACEKYVK